ncbi:DUF6542 domain-containing protein [Corynebacterium halotolerans]|uniref:DUF6542 domain-containing protein n=1 Tax=Corynebacterium halotolerans YIM 70093 = DSM 44683 TaxID=1121362 RepID=M1MWC0_9CORY|nr:hypothetical protein A605_05065 [Corynebacterium halotolerans YIM 70093 = DSM 44683]
MSPKSRSRQATVFTGLPTWSGIAIVLAALVTGLLISLSVQQIGLPFLVCFILSGLFVALLTEPRGLFLTVASMPVLFAAMTVLTAWSVARSTAPEGSAAFSTTSIVTGVYPLLEFFPVLFSVSAGAGAIAILRLWLLRRSGRARDLAAQRTRRRDAENEQRNRATVSRARRRTNQVTVEELLERNRRRMEERADGAADIRDDRPTRQMRPVTGPSASPARPRPETERSPKPAKREKPAKSQSRTRQQRPRRRSLDDDLYSGN